MEQHDGQRVYGTKRRGCDQPAQYMEQSCYEIDAQPANQRKARQRGREHTGRVDAHRRNEADGQVGKIDVQPPVSGNDFIAYRAVTVLRPEKQRDEDSHYQTDYHSPAKKDGVHGDCIAVGLMFQEPVHAHKPAKPKAESHRPPEEEAFFQPQQVGRQQISHVCHLPPG